MAKNDQYYSIVFFPLHGRPGKEFRVGRRVFIRYVALFFLLLFVVIWAFFLIIQGAYRVLDYGRIKGEFQRQEYELEEMKSRYRRLEKDVENLENRQRDIQSLLGITHAPASTAPVPIEQRIARLSDLVKHTGKEVNRLKFRYAKIPSIRPLYGAPSSLFGWRYHPVVGGFRFHQGVDIPGWTGASVRVTADGIVVYSGTSRGFGEVVVVDHFFGYRTIYAHASKRVVRRGDVVQKGQVVVEVGTTGRSTGPHLHYEIRRYHQPINPEPFLDLSLVEAQRWI